MIRRRIMNELQELRRYPSELYSAEPASDDNIYNWHGTIFGPVGSPYEGGVFKLEIKIPEDYPFKPPKIRFLTSIYHPNIDSNGYICLDIIQDNWYPTSTISRVLLTIISLLHDPNTNNPLEPDIATLYLNDRQKYNQLAKEHTQKYAIPSSPVTNT